MGSGASTQVQAVDAPTEQASAQPEKPVVREKSAKSKKAAKGTAAQESNTLTKTSVTAVEEKSSPSKTSAAAAVSKTKMPVNKMEKSTASVEGLQARVKQLEKELGESESEKLDLQDTIQALQERLAEATASTTDNQKKTGSAADSSGGDEHQGGLEETLKAKDHYIEQLEKQLACVQTEANKTRVRLKKKIKTLTAQLNEARQESSIAHLEARERSSQLQDEESRPKSQSTPSPAGAAAEEGQESKFKVILDLSTQVSEQAERIAQLERDLEERDAEIRMLMEDYARASQQSVSYNSRAKSHSVGIGEGDPSSLSRAVGGTDVRAFGPGVHAPYSSDSFTADVSASAKYGAKPKSKAGLTEGRKGSLSKSKSPVNPHELQLERQSTALSDSDSDWEMDVSTAKIHSAPARTRVKSAASGSIFGDKKESCSIPEDDKWSLATDDNDLMFSSEVKSSQQSSARQKRRSALKSKLERTKNERSKALMGPSLAFAAPIRDQLTDTSCNNTPTPRSATGGFEFSTPVEGASFAV